MPDPTAGRFPRRDFMRTAVLSGAGLWVLSDPLLSRALAAVPGATDVAFSQGVASGQVDQRQATLWTALDGIDRPTRLGVEVATDPGFGHVVLRTQALADPDVGSTARVQIGGAALNPGERYWYRFETADGESSPVGTLRLPPPPDSTEPIRIAFFSCQDFLVGNFAPHGDLALQEVDLAVCLGDYIYEKAFSDVRIREVPATPDGSVRTFEEYRALYATYHSDENLKAMRAASAFVAIWDDHEVEDNYAGLLPGGESTYPGSRPIPFPQRRANGYRAFFEAMPVVRDPDVPDKTSGITHYGQVDLFRLDTRQFRTDQPCNPTDSSRAICGLDTSPTRNKSATMMGVPQREWLFKALADSRAPWKFIANQVMAMSLDLFPGEPLNTDAWDGYAYERSLLCDAISTQGVKDVAFFTGDIHTFFAGTLTRTGRQSSLWIDGLKRGQPVATELVISAITSPGIIDPIATTETQRVAAAKVLDPLIKAANKHMRYSNSAYKGYGIATATTDELRVEYRAVRDCRFAESEVFSLATFAQPRGEAVLNQVAGTVHAAGTARVALPSSPPLSATQATQALETFAANH